MQHGLLLAPVLLPLLGGLPVFKMEKRETRRTYLYALLVLELVALLLIGWQGEVLQVMQLPGDIRIVLGADGLGRIFALLVAALWLVVFVFADEYSMHERNRERFLGFYILSLGAMIGICLAGNLVTLYLFYEMMSLLTVFLVIHSGTNKAIDAGIKYLGFSVCGAAMSLLGLFYLHSHLHTDLFVAGGALTDVTAANEGMLLFALFLMVIGFGAKAGLMPLFAWLPTAHPVAPSPASAVLSGLITKMGVLAIIRVVYFQFGMDFVSGTWVQKVVLVLAIYTVFMGSMLAYKENVLKKRLAYSTVSQVSYILFGLMLLNPDGFRGAMLQLVYHAIAKNGLFLVAGALVFYVHRTKVTQMRGMGKLLPVTMWVFALCSLSLIGIPPTGGFVSKWFLAQGGLEFGVLGIVGVAVLMISALLTAGYLLPIVTAAFFPGDDFDYKKLESYVFHTSWRMRVPMLILAAAVLLLGIFPNALDWLIDPVQLMLFT